MSTTHPPKPRSRADAKQASYEALVEAALELFSEKGLNVSLDEVCARAGYTRGAFYVHFKDRDALMAAVMERAGAQSLDNMFRGPDEGLEAAIIRFADALSSGNLPISRRQGVRPYQLLDACARSPEIRQTYAGLVGQATLRLAGAVRASQRAGRIRSDVNPRQLATLLHSAVVWLEIAHDLDIPVDLPGGLEVLRTLLAPGQEEKAEREEK